MKKFNFKFPDLKNIGANLSDRIKSIGKSEGEHGQKLTPKQKFWKFFKYFLGTLA